MGVVENNTSEIMHNIFRNTGIDVIIDEKCIACKYYYGSTSLGGVGRCCSLPPTHTSNIKVNNDNFCSLFKRNIEYIETTWTG